jgi:predicted AAA+ superfamily ATPase
MDQRFLGWDSNLDLRMKDGTHLGHLITVTKHELVHLAYTDCTIMIIKQQHFIVLSDKLSFNNQISDPVQM